MKQFVIGSALLAASCANGPPKGFPLPDGRTGYTAFCNGRGSSMAECYRQAANFCGGKYEIVETDQSSSVVGVDGIVAPAVERNLRFVCPAATCRQQRRRTSPTGCP